MQKTILSKLIEIVLLIALLMPIFGTTAFAVAEEVAANQTNVKTSTRFVDANLSFQRGEETLDSIKADVNDQDLKVRLFLNVKEKGYFNGGQIEIRNPENLTYEFVNPEKESDLIQSVESYLVKLNQIEGTSETFIEIPIKYIGVDDVDASTLLNKSEIELTGEYVNEQGRKYDVYKRTNLNLNWIDNKDIEISNQIQKYIKQKTTNGKEVVLQNLITIKNKNKEIILPTQKIALETSLLKLGEKLPKAINVSIQKASLFNKEENILLEKDFYSWDKENNKLIIEVENAKNENQTYSAGDGNLEILITSFYEIEKDLEKYEGDSKFLVKQYVLTGDSKLSENQKELSMHTILDKETGKLIDISETTDISNISKGILYVNSFATEVKENIVKSKIKLDVSNVEITDSIKIVENEPQYNNGNIEKNFIYKKIEINKKEFDEVFGEGYINIYSGSKLLERLDNKSLAINNKYVYEFKNAISNITIETSKPKKEGEVFIESIRSLVKSSYNIETLKNIETLNTNKEAYVVYNNADTLLKEIKHSIKLTDASSNVLVRTNKTELSTIKTNENIEFIIALNNDKLSSDIYGQTVFEMILPKGIKTINLKNASLIHGKGLKIASSKVIKQGAQHIVQIVLSGKQDGISTGHLTNGTNIVLNTDITLDQWATSQNVEYQVKYSNVLATNYAKKEAWNMSSTFANFEKYGNAIIKGNLKYNAPQGLVLINEFEKYNKNNDSIISINQGYKEGKLDVLSGKRTIDAHMYLLNNSDSEVTSPVIIGRIPNKLNKNVFTNEEIGSSFDMVLAKKIESEKGNYKIYYSTNPNATSDLKNVNNAWSENENIKNAKSFLIVLNNKLPKGTLLKFNYAMEIPANLEHNQIAKTYSFAEYGVNTKKGNVRYAQMSSTVALSTGEGVQLNIDIKANKEIISENEEIIYSLEVANDAKKTDAKKVETYINIPESLEFKGIRDDATGTTVRLSDNKKGAYISLGDIKVGGSIKKDLVFTAKEVKKDEKIELAVNVAAENFEIVKSKKALGSTIESQKLEVRMSDYKAEIEPSTINIYPDTIKKYNVKVINNTGFIYDKKTNEASYSESFNKVNLTLQLPNTLEYVETKNILYKVTEYNKVTNILKIQLLDDELGGGSTVEFDISVKLKNPLPASYVKKVDLKFNAATTSKKDGKAITAESNSITNYIAEKTIESGIEIYNHDNYNESNKKLSSVQENQDIFIKYSIKPSYFIPGANFIFEAPEGIKVNSIYKKTSDGKQNSVLTIADDGVGQRKYVYPFYIEQNKKLEIFVQAQINGIGESSSKIATFKAGMEGVLKTVNLDIKKGAVQSVIKQMYDKGEINISPEDKKEYGLGTDSSATVTHSILGTTWIDSEKNGTYNSESKTLGKVIVELVDNQTQKVVARTVSDENGKYQFDNIVNGNYSAVFKYNDEKYVPTIYNAKSSNDENSKGIKVNVDNRTNKSVAVTDGIQVNFASVKNVDLGLVEKSNFDLSLDGEISEVIIETSNKEPKQYNFNDRKNVKIELNGSELNKTQVLVKYKLRVLNEGEVEGNVLRLNAQIPEGMKFVPELNKTWQIDDERNIFTTALSSNNIEPGNAQNIELTLAKDFNKENLGLSKVNFEIAEFKNSLGLPDRDSTPNNKNIEEDDFVSLELILGLNTGKKIAYGLLILTIISSIGAMIFLVLRKINGKEIK